MNTVCVELSSQSQFGQGAAARRAESLLVAFGIDAVEVAVEDAGVAVIAEKDEGVCQGLEEGFDWGL